MDELKNASASVWFFLAAFALVLVITFVLFIFNKVGTKKRNLPIYWVFVIGTVFSVFSLFLTEYCSYENFINPFFSSIVSTVKIFTFGYDWREIKEMLTACSGTVADKEDVVIVIDSALQKLLVVLSAIAPILTANTLIVAFSESVSIYKNKITFFSRVHVFSELNEKSICLAEDIYCQRKFFESVKIIFANTDRERLVEDERGFDGRVKAINGLTTHKSVFELISKHRCKKTKYYLISSDETRNIENCVALYEEVKMYGDEIYVFSTLDSSEVFIDAIPKTHEIEVPKKGFWKKGIGQKDIKKTSNGKNCNAEKDDTPKDDTPKDDTTKDDTLKGDTSKGDTKKDNNKKTTPYPTKIILVNEAKMSTYNLLLRHPLYEGADKSGKKDIFVVVIGNSKTAHEFAKAALWCGQMNSFSFKMKIIENGDMSDAFVRDYGDLKNKAEKAGVTLDYKFIKADIESSALPEILNNECAEANYFLISTDNDELTMNISEMVRLNFLRRDRNDINPVIVPIIGNMDYYQVAQNLSDESEDVKCYPSGCYCDIYRKKYITQNPVIRLARVLNFVYNINELSNKFPGINLFEFFGNFANKEDYEKNEFFSSWLDIAKLEAPTPREKSKCLTKLEKKFIETLDNFDECSEAGKHSNIASVIHVFYKLRDVGVEIVLDKPYKPDKDQNADAENPQNIVSVFRFKEPLDKELTKEDMTNIFKDEAKEAVFVKIEHNRWVTFHLINGWERWENFEIVVGKKIKTKDERKKLHMCIVKNEELPALEEKLEVGKKHFYKKDCISIRLLELGLLECLNCCDNNPVESIFSTNNPIVEGKHIPVEVNAYSNAQNSASEVLEKPENSGSAERLRSGEVANTNITDEESTQDETDTVTV